MPEIPAIEFERLVARALDDLPDGLARAISNVEIVVEDFPDEESGGDDPDDLLGLYQGIPLTDRDSSYFGVLPDRIVLYRQNIIAAANSEAEARELVRTTVIHEMAHHFGIDDDRLDELGWA